MSDQDLSKRLAARAAIQYLPESGILGLGTGSTARYFIEAVGELVKSGRKYWGVPTSERSREQALSLGIPVLPDEGPWSIDVCVDGADEVSPALDLIKGGGGAHTREKIVNFASRMNIIVVDSSKLTPQLGRSWPVPLEILPYGRGATAHLLGSFGRPVQRFKDGRPVLTDAGNCIFDLHTGPISDPQAMDRALRALPGVVETGLFCGRTDLVLVASGDGGVQTIARAREPGN